MAKEEETPEITASIKGNVLTINIPCATKDLKPSKSGKTLRVASTEGNIPLDLKVQGKVVKLGLNAYISAD